MSCFRELKYITALYIFMAIRLVQSRESVWGVKLQAQNGSVVNVFPNYMYEDSYVTIRGLCESSTEEAVIEIQWILLEIDCMSDMYKTITKEVGGMFGLLQQMSSSSSFTNSSRRGRRHANGKKHDSTPPPQHTHDHRHMNGDIKGGNVTHTDEIVHFFAQYSERQTFRCSGKQQLELKDESNSVFVEASGKVDSLSMQSRDFKIVRNITREKTLDELPGRVARAWSHGMYHLFVSVTNVKSTVNYAASVLVEMRGQYGYLSAIEWPLLPINGTVSMLYLIAGTLWMFLWATAQEHSKKIHIVIGIVAVAGALGNTLCFIDLSIRNQDGVGVALLQWIGKLISNAQLSLTQLLLMVVSTGYGINRPALSRAFIRTMVCLTVLSFVVNCGMTVVVSESLKIKYQQPWVPTFVTILFALVMLAITGWIMGFSIYTFIYLFERRHSSRRNLTIFSVFAFCCITAFTVHIGVGAYSIAANGLFSECVKDWKHEWLLTTVSQVLIFGLLLVLMWLWRPVDERKSSEVYHPLSAEERDVDGNSDDEGTNNNKKFAVDSV